MSLRVKRTDRCCSSELEISCLVEEGKSTFSSLLVRSVMMTADAQSIYRVVLLVDFVVVDG
jgi:hypothetical protein